MIARLTPLFAGTGLLLSFLLLALPLPAQESIESMLAPLPGEENEQSEFPELSSEEVDPTPHLPGLPGWVYLIILFLALIVIALLGFLFFTLLRNNKKISAPPLRNSLAQAEEKLLALRQYPTETPLAEISTRISIIVRQYLLESKSDSSLYQTREEFHTDEHHLASVPEPAKSETAEFLTDLASLQYAPPKSNPQQIESLIERGLKTLRSIAHPTTQPSAPPATDA